ncbi:MAG: radical SAM protein [Chloroflexi bacterium]|nr:radical SAM protein [Chloroflexota bacterium]
MPEVPTRPEIVSWNVTRRCNLSCPHCYLNAGLPAERELTTQEGLRLVDEMAAIGTRMLILSGGEPLLRSDLFQIAARASGVGMSVVLGSNGTLLSLEVARHLSAAGVKGVGISLDSLTPERHDAFRGVAGAWKAALKGLDSCRQAGLPVLIQMSLFDWNYSEIDDMVRFAHDRGAAGFNLYFLVCSGRGEALTDIGPDQYEEALETVVKAQARNPQIMVRVRCAPYVTRVAHQLGHPSSAGFGCMAGISYGRITPEGDLTPCPYLPLSVGNVGQQPLAHLWWDSSLLGDLRLGGLRGRCGHCQYGDSCRGCRARAWSDTGDLLQEDPWCRYDGQTAPSPLLGGVVWSSEAEERLKRVPFFLRNGIRAAVAAYAKRQGQATITVGLMEEVRAKMRPGGPTQTVQ